MFQKFHTDTLASRFIKSLLSTTYIPAFPCVYNGDEIIKDCYYVYSRFIIVCVESGKLLLTASEESTLYPSDNVYPSISLYPGTGYRAAKIKVLAYSDNYDEKYHFSYNSSSRYYDSDTHYQLGRYLRYLKSTKGMNLLPFYNCYDSSYADDLKLSQESNGLVHCERVSKARNRVVCVPIELGHTYTIAIDCPSEVLMRLCVRNSRGYVEETDDNMTTSLQESLRISGKIFSNLSFKNPVKYVTSIIDKRSVLLQNYIYLVIQLPLSNDSAVVVLEDFEEPRGIATHDKDNCVIKRGIKPALLALNTRESYAFSDRLVEYLLGNVISAEDTRSKNIEKVQRSITNIQPAYKRTFKDKNVYGVWDDDIPNYVNMFLEPFKDTSLRYDQDGNVNKDVETILYNSGGNY